MTGTTDDAADGAAPDDERYLSRRAVLGTIGAGALAGTAGTLPGAAQSGGTPSTNDARNETGTPTPTGSPPPAPTGVSATRPTREADIKLTWSEPVDPCDTDLDHYEVLVDGEVSETVPVGVSYVSIYNRDAVTLGVRSVDDAGRRSATKTASVSGTSLVVDPYATVGAETPDQAVATGVRFAVPVVASPALGSPIEMLGETYELSVSTPCVARIRAATARGTATVTDDGTAATLATNAPNPRPDTGDEPLTLGCVEIETLAPGHTGIRMDATTDFAYPSTLSVADDGAVPAEADGLSSSCDGSLVNTVTLDDGTTVRDVDGDGEYMDLTANDEIDNQDVVTYFQHMETSVLTENPQYFDYTDNDEIDYQDLIALWNEAV